MYGFASNPIHIFTNPQVLSPPISALKSECQKRNIHVVIHTDPNELIGLVNAVRIKTFVVIETPRLSATEVSWVFSEKFTFPKSTDNLKIVTYPGKITGGFYDQAK